MLGGRNFGLLHFLYTFLPEKITYTKCWELSKYSQCCYLNPTCIFPHSGWIYIFDYTLLMACWSQQNWAKENNYVLGIEKWKWLLSIAPKHWHLNIWITWTGTLSTHFKTQNRCVISGRRFWRGLCGQWRWRSQASSVLLTSANLFPRVGGSEVFCVLQFSIQQDNPLCFGRLTTMSDFLFLSSF